MVHCMMPHASPEKRHIYEMFDKGNLIGYWCDTPPRWWVWYYASMTGVVESNAWCPSYITLPFDQAY